MHTAAFGALQAAQVIVVPRFIDTVDVGERSVAQAALELHVFAAVTEGQPARLERQAAIQRQLR
ncbi:hypothetical protein D3C77_777220 [compost metagenome]